MNHSTPTTTGDRRARPRGPGCSACAGTTAQACPAPQACEAPDPLDTTPATVGEQVHGLLLIALGAAVCALFLTFTGTRV